jgi:cyclopropane-fatty-acyl-phospholipid synthase
MTDKAVPLILREARRPPRAAQLLFNLLRKLARGRLELVTPAGERLEFAGAQPGPAARLELRDWEVCGQIVRSGDIGFAECWMAGRWNTPDLTALLTLAAVNHAALEEAVYGQWWGRIADLLRQLARTNTRWQARRNIHAHYDLGNEFYARWLDPSMTYSSALFEGDLGRSLEQAQTAKYERILQRLDARPGETILEIGCGWGGFAEHAARTRGCRVHGVTISRRQLEYATARIERAGLAGRVQLTFTDYRDIAGQYDHIVSVEMIEAVGERYWPCYFETLAQRLRPGGRAVIQAITIDDALFARYRGGTDFIRRYIFPGGMLASPSAFREQARRAGLALTDAYAFGPDYAETLKRWLASFERSWPALRGAGFDERFRRLWSFYLAYCEAGFRAGTTDVYQMELCHA